MSALNKLNPFSKISFKDKLFFTKHLSTMIKAGIPISDALASLSKQHKSKKFKEIIEDVLSNIENGKSLAESLKRHPNVFNNFFISLIEIGEESGTLEENLEFLAKQMAKDFTLRKKIQGALLYPGLVFGAATIMGSAISLFVLPKLVDFFDAFDIELPLTTRILLFIAQAMRSYGFLIIGGFFALIIGFYVFIQLPKVKPVWHKIVLKLPIFGNLIAYGQLASFSRNFGVLIKSGVPITRSLDVTSNTLSNVVFVKDVKKLSEELTKGRVIAAELRKKRYKEFPPLVVQMIDVGETTGKLDETLLYLGDFYEEEIDNISKNLTTVLEPILLVGIGIVVAFIALAIISPIYELTGSIRRR
jgi:type IV pilus assembly protein PilC